MLSRFHRIPERTDGRTDRQNCNINIIALKDEKMADDRVVVDNVLCFLIARFGKTGNKQLKSATLDFYSFEDLYQAKQHLLSDVEQ